MTPVLLAPLALGLLALLALPVLAHMALQQPTRRLAYGATLLLERLMKRLRRRRRLRDIPLMFLRILLIALVVIAASRPELRWPGGAPTLGGSGAVVIVLDNSLSMDLRQGTDDGDGTLLAAARTAATTLVRDLPDGTLVGAVTLGGQAARLSTSLSADREGVARAIEEVTQSQGGTDLAGGLRLARQLLAGEEGEVVVYSDEAGPVAVPAAREEIALLVEQGSSLIPRTFRVEDPQNAAVIEARYGDGPEGGSVRVKVASFGSQPLEVPCTVSLPDGTAITAFIEVPAGGVAEGSLTVPRVAEGGVASARIDDGHLAADDAAAFHLPRIGASRVLVVDGDPGATPVASEVYFLERALAPWGGSAVARGGLMPDVVSAAGVTELDPSSHRVLFVANLADPGALATRIVSFVRAGGSVVFSLGDNVTADRYNGSLGALLPAALRRPRALAAPGELGVPTALPDTAFELFRPFARGGRLAFGRIRWNTLFTLEPYTDSADVRTLLTLEGGLPLLVERKVGQGRVLLWTGTLDMDWGNIPLQAIYMPLVQRLVSYLGGEAGGGGERLDARVGQPVSIPLPDAALDVTVTGPGGPVPAIVRAGAVGFVPELAGAYIVEAPGAPPLAWVAVNIDPAESDVRAGPPLAAVAAEIDPESFVRRINLSPWLVLAALVCALVQAVLSGRGASDTADAPPASS